MSRILIVEDDKSISDAVSLNMKFVGYDYMVFDDGKVAAEYLEIDHSFDLALLDIMLTGMDGFELFKYMDKYHIPVIYMTSKTDSASEIRGLLDGAEDYIVKTFDILTLMVRIEKVLKRTGKLIKGLKNEGKTIFLASHNQSDIDELIAEKLGFHYYFAEAIRFDDKNPYGNALISRYPIISAETILIPDPQIKEYDGYYETRCLLKATIDVGDGLNVLVSHFGLNPDEHQNAVKTIVSNLSVERCVLMGDFNVQPDNPVWAPIRAQLYDTAHTFASPKLSFPSDVPNVKIDYIFVSRDLAVSCADIPEVMASDHRPHTAMINMS